MDSLRALLSLCSPYAQLTYAQPFSLGSPYAQLPSRQQGTTVEPFSRFFSFLANYHLFPCLSLSLSLHKHRTTGGRDSARQELPERLPACVPATATASAMPCSALGSPMSHKLTRPPAHTAIINSSIVILFSLTLSLPLRQDLNR